MFYPVLGFWLTPYLPPDFVARRPFFPIRPMPRITNASDARKNCENGFLHLPKLDFHRFSRIFIEVLKIAENLEKQSFTFFAFLPPYIGVSGSLVSRMRKISMRSIDWYQKFLISRLAARYSTVFVFYVRIS